MDIRALKYFVKVADEKEFSESIRKIIYYSAECLPNY